RPMLTRPCYGPQLARRPGRLPMDHRPPAWYRLRAAAPEPAAASPQVRDSRLARLEAVLFSADEPLTARRLATLAELADSAEVKRLLDRLRDLYTEEGAAFQVEELAGGYQLLTRPEFHPWLVRLRQSAGAPKLAGARRQASDDDGAAFRFRRAGVTDSFAFAAFRGVWPSERIRTSMNECERTGEVSHSTKAPAIRFA